MKPAQIALKPPIIDKMDEGFDTVRYVSDDLWPTLHQTKPSMYDWIIIMALGVAALATTAVGIVCSCCRHMEREKNSRLVHAIHEQDRLARELERARIEKEAIERVLRSKFTESGTPDETDTKNGTHF